jgi:hypothetical protein
MTGGRFTTTGHGAWRTISIATLPSVNRERPVRPWVLATMSDAPMLSAN